MTLCGSRRPRRRACLRPLLSCKGQKRRSLTLYPAELRAHIYLPRNSIANFSQEVKQKLPDTKIVKKVDKFLPMPYNDSVSV